MGAIGPLAFGALAWATVLAIAAVFVYEVAILAGVEDHVTSVFGR